MSFSWALQILLREDYGNSTLRLNRLRGLLEKKIHFIWCACDATISSWSWLNSFETNKTKQNKNIKNKNKNKKRPIRETAELDFIRKRR